MSNIVGIGANVCDTLITVTNYPKEDTKLRADAVVQSGGGPCATGLVAASKLGEKCAYIGTLTDDSAGKFLKADLEKYGELPYEFWADIATYEQYCYLNGRYFSVVIGRGQLTYEQLVAIAQNFFPMMDME
jgi:hypothetical protein